MYTFLVAGGLLLAAGAVFVTLWKNGRSPQSVSQILDELEVGPRKKN